MIAISSTVTLFLTVAQLFLQYKSELSRLDVNYKFIEKSYLPSLANALWVYEHTQIRTQLEGITNVKNIVFASVVDSAYTGGYSAGTMPSGHFVKQEFPLTHNFDHKTYSLGKLVIYSSLSSIYQELAKRLMEILIGNAVKTFLVVLSLSVIIRRNVVSRIEELSSLSQTTRTSHIDLEKFNAIRNTINPDEIDILRDNLIDNWITKQNHEEQLEQARKSAETASKAKSIFLANISHELRTPLNAIIGYTNLLQTSSENSKQQHESHLKCIENSSEHLLGIIENILTLTTIEAGKTQVQFSQFNITELLNECMRISSAAARKECAPISLVPLEGNPSICADYLKTKQIVINLLRNAQNHTGMDGKIDIEVRLDSEFTHIIVSDTGSGIAPEHYDSIFIPFFQVTPSDLSPKEGVGLGLPISKRLAELQGGTLNFTSVLGSGSRFTLAIPNSKPKDPLKTKHEES